MCIAVLVELPETGHVHSLARVFVSGTAEGVFSKWPSSPVIH